MIPLLLLLLLLVPPLLVLTLTLLTLVLTVNGIDAAGAPHTAGTPPLVLDMRTGMESMRESF
jgi:hypothetical protein